MDLLSAFLRNRDPLAWHLRYWLGLYSFGILRGIDNVLMALRIDIEQSKIPVRAISNQVRLNWDEYRKANEAGSLRNWRNMSIDSEYYKQFHRDLDRMLVNKEQKVKERLRYMERKMSESLRAANLEKAREDFDLLGALYQKMHAEETADAEARNTLLNGNADVHNQEGHGPETVEAEPIEGEEKMSDQDEIYEDALDPVEYT